MYQRGFVCVFITVLSILAANPGEAARAGPGVSARFEISLDKECFEIGEPIIVHAKQTNLGTELLDYEESSDFTGRLAGYAFEVRREDGTFIKDPQHEYISNMEALGGWGDLILGESHERDLLLNYRIPVLSPGSYSVRGTYRMKGRVQPGHARFEATSEEVCFQVMDTPPEKLDERVEGLARRLENSETAEKTARLLGFTGNPKAVAPLITILETGDDREQVAAVEALSYIDQQFVTNSLVEAVNANGPSYRMAELLKQLLRSNPKLLNAMMEPWLESPRASVRYGALNGLWMVQDDTRHSVELFSKLLQLLHDPLPAVRQEAAAIVAVYQNGEAFNAVKPLVSDPDAGVSQQALSVIGWMATSSAVPVPLRTEAVDILIGGLRRPDYGKYQAAYWLGRAGDKRAIPALRRSLDEATAADLRNEIEQALIELGN